MTRGGAGKARSSVLREIVDSFLPPPPDGESGFRPHGIRREVLRITTQALRDTRTDLRIPQHRGLRSAKYVHHRNDRGIRLEPRVHSTVLASGTLRELVSRESSSPDRGARGEDPGRLGRTHYAGVSSRD